MAVASRYLVPVEDQNPETFEHRILALRRPWNWDGERGRAIRETACRAALNFVRGVSERRPDLDLPRVSPSARGAVALTWRVPARSLTVFFSNSDPRQIAYREEGLDYVYTEGSASRDEVLDLLTRL